MTIQETPVRLPTHIREDAFFNEPRNLEVLAGELTSHEYLISEQQLIMDGSYWLAVVVIAIAAFVVLNHLAPLGIVVFVGAIVIFVISRMEKRNLQRQIRQRFREGGYVLRGEVYICTASTDSGWLEMPSAGFKVKVGYHFTSPIGDTIEATLERERGDLNGKPLPVPGTPVYVLYFNDRDYYLL